MNTLAINDLSFFEIEDLKTASVHGGKTYNRETVVHSRAGGKWSAEWSAAWSAKQGIEAGIGSAIAAGIGDKVYVSTETDAGA